MRARIWLTTSALPLPTSSDSFSTHILLLLLFDTATPTPEDISISLKATLSWDQQHWYSQSNFVFRLLPRYLNRLTAVCPVPKGPCVVQILLISIEHSNKSTTLWWSLIGPAITLHKYKSYGYQIMFICRFEDDKLNACANIMVHLGVKYHSYLVRNFISDRSWIIYSKCIEVLRKSCIFINFNIQKWTLDNKMKYELFSSLFLLLMFYCLDYELTLVFLCISFISF